MAQNEAQVFSWVTWYIKDKNIIAYHKYKAQQSGAQLY